jgi:hypothetical protein
MSVTTVLPAPVRAMSEIAGLIKMRLWPNIWPVQRGQGIILVDWARVAVGGYSRWAMVAERRSCRYRNGAEVKVFDNHLQAASPAVNLGMQLYTSTLIHSHCTQ